MNYKKSCFKKCIRFQLITLFVYPLFQIYTKLIATY